MKKTTLWKDVKKYQIIKTLITFVTRKQIKIQN